MLLLVQRTRVFLNMSFRALCILLNQDFKLPTFIEKEHMNLTNHKIRAESRPSNGIINGGTRRETRHTEDT